MSEQGSAFSGSTPASAVALSPRQFHAAVEALLREAVAEAGGEGDETALRGLAALLRETPSLGGSHGHPPFMSDWIADGSRTIIARRREEGEGPERMLADLLEFVLVFYPEAIPPP